MARTLKTSVDPEPSEDALALMSSVALSSLPATLRRTTRERPMPFSRDDLAMLEGHSREFKDAVMDEVLPVRVWAAQTDVEKSDGVAAIIKASPRGTRMWNDLWDFKQRANEATLVILACREGDALPTGILIAQRRLHVHDNDEAKPVLSYTVSPTLSFVVPRARRQLLQSCMTGLLITGVDDDLTRLVLKAPRNSLIECTVEGDIMSRTGEWVFEGVANWIDAFSDLQGMGLRPKRAFVASATRNYGV